MINAGTHGAVTWIDLSTPDVKAAAEFYRKLLQWNDVEVSPTPSGDYHLGKVGEQDACGMMQQGPELAGKPAMWTMFVYVDDVDAAAARVPEAGGTVLQPPFDIPEARIAIVADPSGAMFGLFAGPQIEGEFYSEDVGRVCWVELMTRDTPAAEGFYADVFGWKAATENVHGAEYTTFELGGEMVAGMMMMPDDVPVEVPPYWGVYFTVADCAATETMVRASGGEVYVPTMTLDAGRFAAFADPQGATFSVMEYAA